MYYVLSAIVYLWGIFFTLLYGFEDCATICLRYMYILVEHFFFSFDAVTFFMSQIRTLTTTTPPVMVVCAIL